MAANLPQITDLVGLRCTRSDNAAASDAITLAYMKYLALAIVYRSKITVLGQRRQKEKQAADS